MERTEIYNQFEELNKRASQGGGIDKIEKQHAAGRMTARERIEALLDKGTFNELDKFVNHRCTNFGMEKKQIPGDGMVTGYGKIDGRPVFVYAYDFTVHGGSLSETNAAKIVKVQQLALKNGAPVIALNDSGGARIQEGVGSLSGYASIFYQNTIASGVIRIDSYVYEGYEIPIYYDPMIGKLIVWATNRQYAIERMRRVLYEYKITGLKTNLTYLKRIMHNPDFVKGEYNTLFIEKNSRMLQRPNSNNEEIENIAMIAAYIDYLMNLEENSSTQSSDGRPISRWREFGLQKGVLRI